MPVISDQCMGVRMVSAMKRWLRVLCFEGRALSAAALFGGLLLGSAALGAAELQTATPESVGIDSERLTRLSTLAADYVEQGKLAGVVTLVNRGGKIVFTDTVGHRAINDKTPLKHTDLFRIYSMTKPITAIAAMQLYERGAFHMSDPITKWLPELNALTVLTEDGERVPVNRPPTMQELLTHTAGFSYGFDPRDPVDQAYRKADLWAAKDLDEFVAKVGELPLKHQPGVAWHYSIAVDLTGLIVERISGQPFDEYLQTHLFEPLGMVDTFFEVPPEKLSRFLPNHRWSYEAGKVIRIDGLVPELGGRPTSRAMGNFTEVTLFSGGGGLVSTARDYMRFAEMLRAGGRLGDQRIIGEKTLQYMTKNHVPAVTGAVGLGESPLARRFKGFGFGLGFGLIEDPVSNGSLSSAGTFMWGGAAGTIFWVDPVEDLVVVSLIQLMVSPWPLREDLRVGVYQALEESYEP